MTRRDLIAASTSTITGLVSGASKAIATDPDTALVQIINLKSPSSRLLGLHLFFPYDCIQVWFKQSGGRAYNVTVEYTKSGQLCYKSGIVYGHSLWDHLGVGMSFPEGVDDVTITRITVLEFPTLTVTTPNFTTYAVQ